MKVSTILRGLPLLLALWCTTAERCNAQPRGNPRLYWEVTANLLQSVANSLNAGRWDWHMNSVMERRCQLGPPGCSAFPQSRYHTFDHESGVTQGYIAVFMAVCQFKCEGLQLELIELRPNGWVSVAKDRNEDALFRLSELAYPLKPGGKYQIGVHMRDCNDRSMCGYTVGLWKR